MLRRYVWVKSKKVNFCTYLHTFVHTAENRPLSTIYKLRLPRSLEKNRNEKTMSMCITCTCKKYFCVSEMGRLRDAKVSRNFIGNKLH